MKIFTILVILCGLSRALCNDSQTQFNIFGHPILDKEGHTSQYPSDFKSNFVEIVELKTSDNFNSYIKKCLKKSAENPKFKDREDIIFSADMVCYLKNQWKMHKELQNESSLLALQAIAASYQKRILETKILNYVKPKVDKDVYDIKKFHKHNLESSIQSGIKFIEPYFNSLHKQILQLKLPE